MNQKKLLLCVALFTLLLSKSLLASIPEKITNTVETELFATIDGNNIYWNTYDSEADRFTLNQNYNYSAVPVFYPNGHFNIFEYEMPPMSGMPSTPYMKDGYEGDGITCVQAYKGNLVFSSGYTLFNKGEFITEPAGQCPDIDPVTKKITYMPLMPSADSEPTPDPEGFRSLEGGHPTSYNDNILTGWSKSSKDPETDIITTISGLYYVEKNLPFNEGSFLPIIANGETKFGFYGNGNSIYYVNYKNIIPGSLGGTIYYDENLYKTVSIPYDIWTINTYNLLTNENKEILKGELGSGGTEFINISSKAISNGNLVYTMNGDVYLARGVVTPEPASYMLMLIGGSTFFGIFGLKNFKKKSNKNA